MPSPLVSVVIPSYNHARYLRAAIDSALAQAVDVEVVVHDDASTDGSWELLQQIGDPRVRVARNASNQGAHHTLQQALGAARGEYLAILNSDDRYAPQRLARMLPLLVDGGADLVGSDIRLIDGEGQAVATHWWIEAFARLKAAYRESGDWVATLLAGNVFMTTSNFVFTRRLWQALAPFSSHRYVHDYDFALRALSHGARLGWVDEALLDYRLHESNTISERPLDANLETAALLRAHLPALLAGQPNPAARFHHLNAQWARIERYECEILRALQHEALVAKDRDWKQLVDDRERWIAERDGWIAERDGHIAERDRWIAERDGWIAERDALLAARGAEVDILRGEIAVFRRRPLRAALRLHAGKAYRGLRALRAKGRQWLAEPAPPVLRATSYAGLRRLVEARRPQLAALSFDVFDTLLSRCIEPPERIVRRVAESLAARLGEDDAVDRLLAARQVVEAELRAAAQAAGRDHECHHDDIIAAWVGRVAARRSADEQRALIDFTARCEYELERLALVAKPNARLFLQWARNAGLRIIAVSDMYLGERHLRALLDDLGYRGLIDRIYVSSEHRVGKYSGRLFTEVLAKEDLQAAQVLHVGDNFHSDALAPSRLGIAGVFLDERHERRRRRRQQTAAELAGLGGVWPGRMLAEIVAERLRHDERGKRDEFFFQYGLEVLGPIFCCFVLGLVERVREAGTERVFFLARDGDLFRRMYERWGELDTAALPPASYAYASRRVVAGAAVAEGLDHDKAVVGLYNPKQRGLQSILKTYGLSPEAFATLAAEHGFAALDAPIDDWQDPRLHAFLADERVQALIRPVGERARELLRDYFAQLGFFSHARVAMVDIGWNGTIQRFMEQAFGDDAGYPQVDGYYFALMNGMYRTPLAQGSIEGLILDQRRASPQERAAYDFEELFEQGARALHATTVGYRREGGAVEPVLKEDAAADRQAEIRCNPLIDSLQDGVLLCLEHFHAAHRLSGFGFAALKPYALALAERAVAYPTAAEVAQVSRLAHTEDFGHDHLLDLSARHIRWRDFLRPRRLMAQLAHLPWRYAPFARFRTPLAPALARALHILQLRRNG